MINLRTMQKTLIDNLPSILTGAAIVGVVETTVLAVKATPKAYSELKDARIKNYADTSQDLSTLQKCHVVYRFYIPTAMCGSATIACIFAANYMHLNREAGLVATYKLFENRYNQYREKNREMFGAENDRQIERSIDKDQMENNPPPSYLKKYAEEDGAFLCYEPLTDQYFTATKAQLMWAEMTANKILQQNSQFTLNQLLKLVPGVKTDTPQGDKIGWYLDDSYYEFIGYNWGFYGTPWVDLVSEFESVDGQEVMVIKFSIAPTYENMWDMDDVNAIKDSQDLHNL